MAIDDGIIFNNQTRFRKLHPAIDKINNTLFFGFQLPVETVKGTLAKDLCFVTSDQSCIKRENLGARNIELRVPSIVLPARWTLNNINSFLHSSSREDYTLLPKQLYDELKKYVDLPDERTGILIALWIIGTYLQPIWNSYPYLSVSGTKRSGKSKLLKFLSMTTFNSIFSTSMSTAMLYRLIESLACTMLLDESEKYSSSDKQEEIRNILNSGYKKYGKVYRSGKTKNGQIVPEQFETFSPKVIVTYKGLEGITEDRSIPIVMLRSKDLFIVNTEVYEDDPKWSGLRDKLYRFALTHWQTVEELYLTEEISVPHENYMSRERELWKPILSLASYFKLADKITPYVVDVINEKLEIDSNNPEQKLLESLAGLVDEMRSYSNAEIRDALTRKFEDNKLPDYVSSSWIGNTLRRQFKIKEGMRRGTSRGYWMSPAVIKRLCYLYDVDYVEVKNDEMSEKDQQKLV